MVFRAEAEATPDVPVLSWKVLKNNPYLLYVHGLSPKHRTDWWRKPLEELDGYWLYSDVVEEVRRGLRQLAQTDPGGKTFDLVYEQPEVLINAIFRRMVEGLSGGIDIADLPPLCPEDLDSNQVGVDTALVERLSCLWPTDAYPAGLAERCA